MTNKMLIYFPLILLCVNTSSNKLISDSSCRNDTNSCFWIIIRQLVKLETLWNEFESKLNHMDSKIVVIEQRNNQSDNLKIAKFEEAHRKITNVEAKTKLLEELSEKRVLTNKTIHGIQSQIDSLQENAIKTETELAAVRTKCETTQTDFVQFQKFYISSNKNTSKDMTKLELQLKSCKCTVKDQSNRCPSGWRVYGNHCYYYAMDLKSWQDAVEACKQMNSYLVKVEKSAENNWLKSIVKDDTWIGANDLQTEGQWRWVSDQTAVTFTDWEHLEPSNAGGMEHCATLWKDRVFKWNDRTCNTQTNYVCEMN